MYELSRLELMLLPSLAQLQGLEMIMHSILGKV